MMMTTALYNGVEIENVEDDCGKPFRFAKEWRVLSHHQKFMVSTRGSQQGENLYNALSNTGTGDSGGVANEEGTEQHQDISEHSVSFSDRPVGRKKAKMMKTKSKENAKNLPLAAESVATQKERNDALKPHYEIMLFTNAPAGCNNSESVKYFRIMRTRALKKLRPEEAANEDAKGDE